MAVTEEVRGSRLGGTFALTFAGRSTPPLAYDASPRAVGAAVETLIDTAAAWALDGSIDTHVVGPGPSFASIPAPAPSLAPTVDAALVHVTRSTLSFGFVWTLTFAGPAAVGDTSLLGTDAALLTGSEATATVQQAKNTNLCSR